MSNKKELSERDICTQFILPALVKSGWDIEKQVREEVFFTDGRIFVKGNKTTRGKRKRADFILYLNEDKDAYKEFSRDFFDHVVVDECHRGSAAADSAWRAILDYFCSATHIGLTATPRETKEISNVEYFGDPIYTYTLRDGTALVKRRLLLRNWNYRGLFRKT